MDQTERTRLGAASKNFPSLPDLTLLVFHQTLLLNRQSCNDFLKTTIFSKKKKMEEKPECGLQEKIKELKEIKESCHKVEEDLEDEINDKFSIISVLLEERRRNIVSQLRSQVSGKCQRIGQWSVVRPVL